MILMRVSKQK